MIKFKLRDVRKSKKYTIEYLAKMSGISMGEISNIENNLVTPTIYTVLRLSKSLHVSMYDLFVED